MKNQSNNNGVKNSSLSDEEIIEIKKKELVENWSKMHNTNEHLKQIAKTRGGGELKLKDDKINKALTEYVKLKTKCEAQQKEIDELKNKVSSKKVCNMDNLKVYDINDIDLEKESNNQYNKIKDKEMAEFNKFFE
jgi:hypothetical protein